MLKKLLASILLAIFLLTTFSVPYAEAQGNWYNQGFPEWYTKVYDTSNPSEIFGERYTAAQVQWILYSIPAIIINLVTQGNTELSTCAFNTLFDETILVDECAKGIETHILNIYRSVFDHTKITSDSQQKIPLSQLVFRERSLSGIGYVKQKLGKLNLIPEVEAQSPGYGYGKLGIVQNWWKGARDFSYAILVIITIVFSFMIMFRTKISPQTVITIQSSLPKLVITLILITFSYAIAGFMVDLLYVAIGVVSLLMSAMFGGSSGAAFNIISGEIPVLTTLTGSFMLVLYFLWYIVVFAFAVLWSLFATFLSFSNFGTIVSLIAVLVWVITIVMLLLYLIKVPWVLIKALGTFYLSVVFGPIQIGVGALVPSFGFGNWLKKMASSLSVFLLTGTLYYLALYLLYQSFVVNLKVVWDENIIFELLSLFGVNTPTGILSGTLWSPPLLGSGAEMSGLILIFLSFTIIAIMPKGAEMLQGAIEGKPIAFGIAIGEALGPVKTGGMFAGMSAVESLSRGRIPFSKKTFSRAAGTKGEGVAKAAAILHDMLRKAR